LSKVVRSSEPTRLMGLGRFWAMESGLAPRAWLRMEIFSTLSSVLRSSEPAFSMEVGP